MATKHTGVVVDVVVRRAVVVVETPTVGGVVCDDKVVVHVVDRRHRTRRLSVAHRRNVRQSIPAVERSVVAAFAASVEQQIRRHLVPTAEAVVEVDCGPWNVEHDVVADRGPRSFRLEVEGRLLLDVSNFVAKVVADCRATGVQAVQTGVAVGSSPRRNGVLTERNELVAVDSHVYRVAVDGNGVAVQMLRHEARGRTQIS